MTAATQKRSSAPTEMDDAVRQRVRSVRTQRGRSQSYVADGLGIVHQQYHKYESGVLRISAGMLIKIAACLECSVTDLLPPESSTDSRLDATDRVDLLKQKLVQQVLECESEARLLAMSTLIEPVREETDILPFRIPS